MSNIFFPKIGRKGLYISTLSKGKSIDALSLTIEERRVIENSFFRDINVEKPIFMYQVHKDNIVKIDSNNFSLYSRDNPVPNCDAIVSNLKNVPLVVQTADCLPIILYCEKSRAIAAIHSGWRGTNLKIVSKTIRFMEREYSSDINNMYAYIGAHIFMNNYKVGEDVASLFRATDYIDGKWYFDNSREAILQMLDCGIKEENIENSNLNSYDIEFYSYRREGTQVGRILTLAMLI